MADNEITENTEDTEDTNEEGFNEQPPADSMSAEDFDNSGDNGFDLLSQMNDTSKNTDEDSYEQDNNGYDSEYTEPESGVDRQSQGINDAEPNEKKNIKDFQTNNKGIFFQRNKVLIIVAGVLCLFILFFSFFGVPAKKKKDTQELDKAGYTFVPDFIKEDTNDYQKESFTDTNSAENGTNGNSAKDDFDKIMEQKYPNPIQKTEPSRPPANTGSSPAVEVPLTNRNEQQKPLQHLSLDDSLGSKTGFTSKGNTSTQYPYAAAGYTPSSSSFTPTSLNENVQRYIQSMSGNGSSYERQNDQSSKQRFLNTGKGNVGQQWNSEYSLWKGTIISAVLDTGINTDLPGNLMAHVTKNVYSSLDSKYLLIPQGSRLYGEYNSEVTYGQKRVQVVWNTLIRPDGLEINLGSMEGIDAYGFAGYNGFKNDHPFAYAKAMGLIAMFSILDTKMMNQIDTANNTYAQNAMSDVYNEAKQLNNKILDRALDIQPTLTIQPGTEVNLITNVTIDLPPLEDSPVTQKYVRH